MLNNRTTTNVTLFLIAGALLVAVAQGGLAQLSSLFTAAPVEQTTTTTNGQPDSSSEVGSVPVPPLAERLLVYVLLVWALALGVEAGVELIRLSLRQWLPMKPGPAAILKELNPWLPAPAAVSEAPGAGNQSDPVSGNDPALSGEQKPEVKQVQGAPSPQAGGAGHQSDAVSRNGSAPLGERGKALLGIALRMDSGVVKNDRINPRDWSGIFQVFALEQQAYLKNQDKRLRLYRTFSLFVAVTLAFLTGVNSFSILLGSDTEGQKAFSQLFSTASGIAWYKIGGVLLSAFAATAGSAVWHDLLDKLRQSKEPEAAPEKTGPQ